MSWVPQPSVAHNYLDLLPDEERPAAPVVYWIGGDQFPTEAELGDLFLAVDLQEMS